MLDIGDAAPDFELSDQAGRAVTLDGLVRAGELILYFYPADFTPLCTAQACAFRDRFAGLSSVGMQIVGVSPQSMDSHARFASAHSLPFALLSDTGKTLIRAFGVDGPFGFGVRRVTFLIDRSKTIRNRVVADLFLGSHKRLIERTLVRTPE